MIHEFFKLFQTAAAILCAVSHPEHKGKTYYSSVLRNSSFLSLNRHWGKTHCKLKDCHLFSWSWLCHNPRAFPQAVVQYIRHISFSQTAFLESVVHILPLGWKREHAMDIPVYDNNALTREEVAIWSITIGIILSFSLTKQQEIMFHPLFLLE